MMHRVLGTNDSPDSLAAAAMREWALARTGLSAVSLGDARVAAFKMPYA